MISAKHEERTTYNPTFFHQTMNNESEDFIDDFEHALDAYERKDYKAAFKLWFPIAEQGYADAQNFLGIMYSTGKGVLQDYKEAVKWFRLSAEQGDADAQYFLGIMFEGGLGVEQDYKEALKWYRLAAEQRLEVAQYHLECMHLNLSIFN